MVPRAARAAKTIDTTRAHPARVYDYWLGGKNNFEADRDAAERAIRAHPPIVAGVRAQRAFLTRAVTFLAGEAGVRQFLDVGAGLPAADNTHEVAQRTAAGCRVVYVDNDPMVIGYGRGLLADAPLGTAQYVDADLRDTGTILAEAGKLLDFTQPIALMLIGILHFIPDRDDPYVIVGRLRDALPAGSWLMLAHPAEEIQRDQTSALRRNLNEDVVMPATFRTHLEISQFFDGLRLAAPGVVQLHRWRPGPDAAGLDKNDVAAYCGLAQKP